MRTFHRLLLRLCIVFVSTQLCASEVDSFTDRDPTLLDASHEVNRIINGYMADAMAMANKSRSCDQVTLNKALLNRFYGKLWTAIENDIMSSSKIDKRQSPIKESVYQDFDITETFVLHFAKLGALMRFGEFYVGTDKLGHFLQVGYEMFDEFYGKGKNFQGVIDWNKWTEESYNGLISTGIFSYADLASNYDGLYFWERVTNTRLPPGVKPYFECVNNTWWHASTFDIADYLNAAWDEGQNCNVFKTPKMEKKVKARIAQLETKTGRPLQCPIQPKQCLKMLERYGNVAKHVITPKCF